MATPARKSTAVILTSSCLTLATGLMWGAAGCDNDTQRADKAVEASLHAAQPERGQAAIAGGFKQASQEPGASPAALAHAKVLLARRRSSRRATFFARSTVTKARSRVSSAKSPILPASFMPITRSSPAIATFPPRERTASPRC
jgi:hypothetical protein